MYPTDPPNFVKTITLSNLLPNMSEIAANSVNSSPFNKFDYIGNGIIILSLNFSFMSVLKGNC